MAVLFRVTSESWRLEIRGIQRSAVDLQNGISTQVRSSRQDLHIETYRRQTGLVLTSSGDPVPPFLFENTNYDLYLDRESPKYNRESPKYKLDSTGGVTVCRETENTIHASLNFGNSVGYTDLAVLGPDQDTRIQLEVFPTKIGYRSDYLELRDDVSEVARGLALWVQRKTYGTATRVPANSAPSLVEWKALMQEYFEELVQVARNIVRNYRSKLAKTTRPVRPDRAKKLDRSQFRRLSRRQGGKRGDGGFPLPRRVPEVKRHVSPDIPANQYVKATLRETVRKLSRIVSRGKKASQLEESEMTAADEFYESFRNQAESMSSRLQSIMDRSFFGEVSDTPSVRPDSPVLDQDPYYRSYIRLVELLNGGLDLQASSPLRVGIKDISLLYEYWCFLKIVHLLQERHELVRQDFVEINDLRFAISLRQGDSSRVSFLNPATGETIDVHYNRSYTSGPTTNQRPDHVIQVGGGDKSFVFDAKYRISSGKKYKKKYGSKGPKPSDINTMHRYRDAIVVPRPDRTYGRVVESAIVLFPGDDESDYEENNFYESIDKVRVGGLPFLPGSTELMAAELGRILDEIQTGIT